MDWNSFAQAQAANASNNANALVQSAVGSQLSLKASKALFDYQHEYALKDWQMQNERQDYLMANSVAIQKEALRNAGYSTADPNGTGVQTAAVSDIHTPSGSQISANPQAFGTSYRDIREAELLGAQKDLIVAQKENLESKTAGQNIHNQLLDTYGSQQLESAIGNLDADTKKKIEESIYTNQKAINDLQLTDATIRNIEERLEMDWNELPLRLKLLSANVELARSSGALNYSEVKKNKALITEITYKIRNLRKEYGLTDAQIDVAFAMAENLKAQADLAGAKVEGAEAESWLKKFEQQLTESLGLDYAKVKKIADDIFPYVNMFSRDFTKLLSSKFSR